MDEDEEETTPLASKTASTLTLIQQSLSVKQISSTTSIATLATQQQDMTTIPQCQIVTHQPSGDSQESEESTSTRAASPRYSLLSKSPHSSSSQEDYEPPSKGQFLSAGIRTEGAKSMESLRTTRTFLSTSERDMRRIDSEGIETKSLESLEREVKLKRHAVSGEGGSLALGMSEETISAEKRRGLWSGRVRVPQHLSLPPPAGYLNLSPGDRKLTILSPHSPMKGSDYMHMSTSSTLKIKRKKGFVLPRLVLPRSDSDISEVFSEHGFE
ncbi:hypothetical protein QE152_g9336 [Popillia japonica]|uniref:Uncharacterized protein n=1 Tax=Popillia japonica TaxID=7064 RepID=A0AAW1LYL6_POPJA